MPSAIIKDEYRIKEVADMIGEPVETVRSMVRRGHIPSVWRGRQRKVKAATIKEQFPDCWTRYVAEVENETEFGV